MKVIGVMARTLAQGWLGATEEGQAVKRGLFDSMKTKLLGKRANIKTNGSAGAPSITTARAGLHNSVKALLYSNKVCDPSGVVFSTIAGAENGPGALAADVKEALGETLVWIQEHAGDAGGDLIEVIEPALEMFE